MIEFRYKVSFAYGFKINKFDKNTDQLETIVDGWIIHKVIIYYFIRYILR